MAYGANASTLAASWHPESLPAGLAAMLRRGVLRKGRLDRLREALSAVDAGRPLTVVAIGASVTANHGGAVGVFQDQFPLRYIAPVSSCTGLCDRPGWLRPVFDFITPPATRHPRSVLVNAGQAGVGLYRYLDCTATVVPDAADLVIIDAATIKSHPAQHERVLRRMLRLKGAPALLLLSFPRWCTPVIQGCDDVEARCPERIQLHRNASCYSSSAHIESTRKHLEQVERPLLRLADHYGLPMLSAGAAFMDAVNAREVGFHMDRLTGDSLHPVQGCTMDILRSGGSAEQPQCRYELLVAALVNSFIHHSALGGVGRAAHRSFAGAAVTAATIDVSRLTSGRSVWEPTNVRCAYNETLERNRGGALGDEARAGAAAHFWRCKCPPLNRNGASMGPPNERCFSWGSGWHRHTLPDVVKARSHGY